MRGNAGVAIINLDTYRDTGCRLHSACLTCPFAVCVYEAPGSTKELMRDQAEAKATAKAEAVKLLDAGTPVPVVAQQMRVSTRTVHRWQREAAGLPPR